MKIQLAISSFALVLALGAPTAFARNAQENPPARPPRVIQMTAKMFEFDPAEIHVKVGEKIQLEVTAEDRTHGLRIDPFPDGRKGNTPPGLSFTFGDDCLKVKKGETATVEFTAQAAGTYSFSCCKKCGSGHGRMKGKIIVEP